MGLFSKSGKNKQESAGAGQDSGYYSSADDQAVTERARSKRASSADGPAKRGRANRETDDPVLPEKKRARRRLVGAIALALLVAIGLPMVLDSEPKPLASDIDIKIPSKDKAAEPAARAPIAPVSPGAALDSKEEIVPDAALAAKPAPAPAAATPPVVNAIKLDSTKPDPKADADARADARLKAEAKAEALSKAKAEHELKARQEADYKQEVERKQAEVKAEAKLKADKEAERKLADAKAAKAAQPAPDSAKPAAKSEDARALAILEGKPAAAETGQKFVLQVAALADQDKVDELREKLKKAGISSFTQKAPSGGVTRIRVGPFSSKDEAEKMRAKLSGMGLSGRLESV
jgi:DedD protein